VEYCDVLGMVDATDWMLASAMVLTMTPAKVLAMGWQ